MSDKLQAYTQRHGYGVNELSYWMVKDGRGMWVKRLDAERQLETAQQRIAELENSEKTLIRAYTHSSNVLDKHLNRAEAAEAELARRDAAAGEPIYQFNCGEGWQDVNKIDYERYINASGISTRKVYSAAQPSALPPEMTRDVSNYDVVDHGFISGYNQAIADAKALGCKEIKLPEPYDDGHGNEWIPRSATIQTLKALGFTVEGE